MPDSSRGAVSDHVKGFNALEIAAVVNARKLPSRGAIQSLINSW